MLARSSYPAGVPCWLDLTQPDPLATRAFYAGLFDWDHEVRTPPEAPVTYAYARRDGLIAAGLGGPPQPTDPPGWTTYVSVVSAAETCDRVAANGGEVVLEPVDIPRSGRVAQFADPHGAAIGVWEPGELPGVELVNAPGSWNFSELHTPDPDKAIAFYAAVFGWECDRIALGGDGEAWLFRVPGYGEHLAASDPDIRERQADDHVPEGFADAVAWLEPYEATDADEAFAHWSVTFAVADADAAVARAVELGADVVTPPHDAPYVRASVVRDPQGARMTLSEYRPEAL